MSMIYLKKPEYKGKRFISFDGSSSFDLKKSNKYLSVLSLLLLTALGVFISLRLNTSSFGIDQAVALLFWITMIYLWIKLLNMPVEISLKDNRIFFTDYISNIKYFLISDLLTIEQKKSMIHLVAKNGKITFQSGFDGLNELLEELSRKNSELKSIGFNGTSNEGLK
ncbi:MAG: hypothetical protein P4L35_06180 [Ignavibacteriaceae bacterium]|nr:hypothetical protein [Ignavibacteriaceae bacterium]